MQTILGGGGAIGTPLGRELKKYTNKIRIVSRNAKKLILPTKYLMLISQTGNKHLKQLKVQKLFTSLPD